MIVMVINFGGALLVVSILGVVYDCHWWPLLRSWGDMGPFWPAYSPFRAVNEGGGLVGLVQS